MPVTYMTSVHLHGHVVPTVTCTKVLKDVYEHFYLKAKLTVLLSVLRKLNREELISQNPNSFSDKTGASGNTTYKTSFV